MSEPNYEFIKALGKFFSLPLDKKWQEISIEPNGDAFVKYECSCLKRKAKKESALQIILKPYAWSLDNVVYTYYIGQCPRCEIIYYVKE